MKMLFEVTDLDRRFYEERLRGFLPETVIDVHTHVWSQQVKAPVSAGPLRAVTWPARVARESSAADLAETYRLMFPGKKVTPLIFGNVLDQADDIEGGNGLVAEEARQFGFPSLLFAKPQWTAEELDRRLVGGPFLGIKVYLTLADAYLPEKEIRIFDFLPPHQLDVIQRRRGIVMLHIPRDGRLRDPVNLTQMIEIEQRWPDVKVIIAHVGRAYCPEDIGTAFETLKQTKRMVFDFSANTNADVFQRLIETVGPGRILFGSDLPITRMRMRRICEKGNYVNLVPRGLYGDVSGDRHMRELTGAEATGLSFFLYEEIDAFRQAAEAAALSRADIEDVFHNNAARLIKSAGAGKGLKS
jgi:predicted TIM-barrel fold metal-dependent hydrolase